MQRTLLAKIRVLDNIYIFVYEMPFWTSYSEENGKPQKLYVL